MKSLELLEKAIGYRFHNSAYATEALTHPSASGASRRANYERLELLGDAVLGLIISEWLLSYFKEEKEGQIAKRRAGLVCGTTLAQVARSIGLGDFIILGEGEAASGGRDNDATLENAIGALIGAIYSDGGLEAARAFILPYFTPLAEAMLEPPRDPKTQLQEWAQGRGLPIPEYRVTSQHGPAHAPTFTVEVQVQGFSPASASGSSKRVAERDAAAKLIEKI